VNLNSEGKNKDQRKRREIIRERRKLVEEDRPEKKIERKEEEKTKKKAEKRECTHKSFGFKYSFLFHYKLQLPTYRLPDNNYPPTTHYTIP